MGLGKVIGLGIAFMVLLIPTIGATISGILEIIASAIHNGYIHVGSGLILSLTGYMFGAVFFAFITYLVGKVFIKAYKEYFASQARKPLQ